MTRKRQMPVMGIVSLLLFALALIFVLRLLRHRPPSVELPASEPTQQIGVSAVIPEQSALRPIAVTPQTVRLVIERLARPGNYRRTLVIERFWNGGSGVTTANVSVADGWTRVEQSDESGDTRHSITSPEGCWIWYGGDVYHGAAALTADEEQGIPTYETILRLAPSEIAVADYRSLDGLGCIFVETEPDSAGYVDRYFIAADSGVLTAMERIQGGTTVYRMTALSPEFGTVDEGAFTLPDGTVLCHPSS